MKTQMKEYLKNICNVMKKNIFISSIIGLSLFACTSEHTDSLVENAYKLEANIENPNVDSRVGFENETGKFFWTENDQIGITTTSSATTFQKMTLNSGAGKANGVFEGTINGTPNGYAVYPFISENNHSITNNGILTFNFPETYTYTSLDKDYGLKNGNSFNAPMWSKIGEELSFKHLGGVICILVNGLPIGNDLKFTLTTSNKITGSFSVDLTVNKPTLETTASTTENTVNITFSNANDDEIGVFYIPVPTGTYANITAIIMNGNNLIASKEWTNQTVNLGTLKKGIITHTSRMKKLISIQQDKPDYSPLKFEYNTKGELIKDNNWNNYDTNNYSWNANIITMTNNYNNNNTYTLNNALLGNCTYYGDNWIFEYDELTNKLKSISSNGRKFVEITWANGRIAAYTRSGDGWTSNYTVTYRDNVTTGWCPLYDCELWDELSYFLWANPHLCGMSNHYLPVKIEDEDDIVEFSYELDNDGYVSKVYVEKSYVSTPNQVTAKKTYIYTWQ